MASMICIAVISKPGCCAPSRAASPCSTSWLERHSPGGSISFGPIWRWVWPPAWYRSSCSMNIVAGSTMSAQRAVSVMNCSCTQTNRSSRAEAAADAVAVGADRQRILVLDQQSMHLRPIAQFRPIPRQHAPDPAHVEFADGAVARIEPLDQRLVDVVHAAVRPQRAAALVLPGAGDGRQAGHRVHVRRAVAAARETVAATDVAALGAAIQRREFFDLLHRQAGDRRRPLGAARLQMHLQRVGIVGVARHVGAVGVAVAERHVHHRAGQRAVGAGARRQMQVRRRRGRRAIRIDHHQFRSALFPRACDVRHHVDLGGDGIAAPHHDQVRLRHLARIDAAALADAGLPAGFRQRGADGEVLPRVAHDVAQPVDAVALHQAHRAGIVERPDRFCRRAAQRRR